jgi:menaquinone-9 beta-reductase
VNARPTTSLEGERPDVLVCGASFAGLAVARELAGSGVDVLVLDRAPIGEHPTSACAVPLPWLEALGLEEAIVQEAPDMLFATPHGAVRVTLPWSWAAFDYRALCRLLWTQTDARFEQALVRGHADGAVRTDRGTVRAPLVVDALGWRRVLGLRPVKPPSAPLTRGLEVHPRGTGDALEVIIDRSLVRRGYSWLVPGGEEVRVGAATYDPHVPVKGPTAATARRYGLPAVRHQGNWIPHRLRPAVENGVFFVGDSAGHCFGLSAEGIRTAFYFGTACGRELRRVVAGESTREEALARYGAFGAGHRRTFAILLGLQRLIPALPPRVLTLVIRALSPAPVVRAVFDWYLGLAHPSILETYPWGGGLPGPRRGRGLERVTYDGGDAQSCGSPGAAS